VPSFHRAVISLWFRVPAASMEAKQADGSAADPNALFRMTIPLLTFGEPITQHLQETVSENIAVPVNFEGTPVIMSPTSFTITGEAPLEPSYIGIECSNVSYGRLVVNLQMPGRAVLTEIGNVAGQVSVWNPFGTPPFPPDGYDLSPGTGWSTADGAIYHTDLLTDVSDSRNARPEYFHIDSPLDLAPDLWHHVLLSVDLSDACNTHGPPQTHDPAGSRYATTAEGTDSHCRLWLAIDDVNQPLDALGPYAVDGSDDANAVLTENAWNVANYITGLVSELWDTPATCTYPAEYLPASGGPFGIPASAGWVDSIYKTEFAELQMFTDVHLDTGVTANRRAFVDAVGKPVAPQQAETLLGKKPDVLLHGTGNWQTGTNTGPPYVPNPGPRPPDTIPDPAKALTPTGRIDAFKPEPALGA
jgi:hypothetical protein